ncbi:MULTISPECIES: hypothetical protein [unclassified Acidovorax]|uniref:hypothetical protein n=1 Tax=unclassified Acidovorax TaxID=2684926 RepID=UPI002883415E|nr:MULTISPECIES: hypothetical protein [unclassified Acidovorax]
MSEQRFSGWHGPTTGDLHGRKAFADSAALWPALKELSVGDRFASGEHVIGAAA